MTDAWLDELSLEECLCLLREYAGRTAGSGRGRVPDRAAGQLSAGRSKRPDVAGSANASWQCARPADDARSLRDRRHRLRAARGAGPSSCAGPSSTWIPTPRTSARASIPSRGSHSNETRGSSSNPSPSPVVGCTRGARMGEFARRVPRCTSRCTASPAPLNWRRAARIRTRAEGPGSRAVPTLVPQRSDSYGRQHEDNAWLGRADPRAGTGIGRMWGVVEQREQREPAPAEAAPSRASAGWRHSRRRRSRSTSRSGTRTRPRSTPTGSRRRPRPSTPHRTTCTSRSCSSRTIRTC